ncbi:hypothetical protein ICA16_12285 [Pseudomonas anatoliensis]|uniref:DUF6402 family protein n=1 Tax=Pseudomonas anatoliensis TaxID=2710589 RepID=UPI001B324E9D|nr:DUF6402 family protein [Pseudomonas anatoliensis]MBP5956444.1 hypothetical protein [Pseudomonas anatoliensis]
MAAKTVATTMTPASNKTGQTATARQFKITDIPATMKKINWPVAAALMSHWFNGEPWATKDGGMDDVVKRHDAFAPANYIEESIVKMNWVLGFERANAAFKHLKANWNSPPGINLIKKRLRDNFSNSVPGCYPVAFNGVASAAEKFGYSNNKVVEFEQAGADEVNELRAALANFNMRVIAEGSVVVTGKSIVFTPSQIGFYIEDAYDFNDGIALFSQILGYWNFDKLVTDPVEGAKTNTKLAAEMTSLIAESTYKQIKGEQSPQQKDEAVRRYRELEGKHYMLVQNSDFRDYRDQNKKGGDFRVYSDILYESVSVAPIEEISK